MIGAPGSSVKLVAVLRQRRPGGVAASPDWAQHTGGEGLRSTGRGTGRRRPREFAVIRRSAVMNSFATGGRPLLAADTGCRERDDITSCASPSSGLVPAAGERLPAAKVAQENLIKASGIVHRFCASTQFFEFLGESRFFSRREDAHVPSALGAAGSIRTTSSRTGRFRARRARNMTRSRGSRPGQTPI